jgi:hypothetical protein
MHYRFYSLDQVGRIRFSHGIECTDDTHALQEGLRSGDTYATEIWQDSRLIARFDGTSSTH